MHIALHVLIAVILAVIINNMKVDIKIAKNAWTNNSNDSSWMFLVKEELLFLQFLSGVVLVFLGLICPP